MDTKKAPIHPYWIRVFRHLQIIHTRYGKDISTSRRQLFSIAMRTATCHAYVATDRLLLFAEWYLFVHWIERQHIPLDVNRIQILLASIDHKENDTDDDACTALLRHLLGSLSTDCRACFSRAISDRLRETSLPQPTTIECFLRDRFERSWHYATFALIGGDVKHDCRYMYRFERDVNMVLLLSSDLYGDDDDNDNDTAVTILMQSHRQSRMEAMQTVRVLLVNHWKQLCALEKQLQPSTRRYAAALRTSLVGHVQWLRYFAHHDDRLSSML